MPIKKKEVMWEELEKFKAGTWTLGSHTHPRSEISDFWATAFWGNIPDKPSTYPPSSHTHDDRYYTETELNTGQLDDRYKTHAQITDLLSAQDALAEMEDVTIAAPADGQVLTYNASLSDWRNEDPYEGADELVKVGGEGTHDYLNPLYFERSIEDHIICVRTHELAHGAYLLNTLVANNKVPDSNKLNGQLASYYAVATHTHDDRYHTKAQITDLLSAQDALAEMEDVTIAAPADGQVLMYVSAFGDWRNRDPAAGTDELVKVGPVGTPDYLNSTYFRQDENHIVPRALFCSPYTLTSLAGDNKSIDSDKVDGEHASAIVTKARVDAQAADHGALSGRGDDDHSIYTLASGTRAFTGVVSGVTPTLAAHLATKAYVDGQVAGVNEFTELTDTPSNYTGSAGKFVKVNATPDALVFADIVAGDLPSHTHVKADITDTPWAWADVSKTGSNLTDLVTRLHSSLQSIGTNDHHPQSHTLASHSTKAHSELTGIGANDHHPQSHTLASHSTKAHNELTGVGTGDHHAQLHASAHLIGGGDPLSVGVPVDIGTGNAAGTATNFARRDHVHNHPQGLGVNLHHNEIHALAGTDHSASGLTVGWVIKATGATTFAWGQLPHDKLGGLGDDDHTQYYNATRHTVAVHNTLSIDHGSLGGRTDDDHTQYHNNTRGDARYHTKAQITDLLSAQDALAEMEDVTIAAPADGQVLMYVSAFGDWRNRDPAAGTDELVKVGPVGTPDYLNSTYFDQDENHIVPRGIFCSPYTLTSLAGDNKAIDSDKVDGEHASAIVTKARIDAQAADHGSLGGRTDDDHSIYYNAARHTKAVHDALGILHSSLGGRTANDHHPQSHTLVSHSDFSTYLNQAVKTTSNPTFGGTIYNPSASYKWVGSGNSNTFYTPYGNIQFGPINATWCHVYTDRANFYFNKNLYVLGDKVWHEGNDGSGSGLDADKVDGYHHTSFMKLAGGTFSGAAYARDHGPVATDEIVNVCFGTSTPPAVGTTTIGTIFLKYI